MRAGDLKRRITLQSFTRTADGLGGYTTVPKDEWTVWGAVWPVSAAETVQASASSMVISHRMRIRYVAGVRPDWRVKYGDRYFNIVSIVDPNEAHRALDILVKEVAA